MTFIPFFFLYVIFTTFNSCWLCWHNDFSTSFSSSVRYVWSTPASWGIAIPTAMASVGQTKTNQDGRTRPFDHAAALNEPASGYYSPARLFELLINQGGLQETTFLITQELAQPVSTEVAKVTYPEKEAILQDACGGEEKCVCVNNAIFVHDSGWATAGVGERANNPCNMRRPSTWEPQGVTGETNGAVGKFLVFESLEHGVNACVETYKRFYENVHYDTLVSKWTAGGGDKHYRTAVANCYS